MAAPPEPRGTSGTSGGSDWELLLRHLEFSEGFSLSFLIVTDRYAERETIDRLRAWLAARSRKLVGRSFETLDDLTSLATWLVDLPPCDPTTVILASAAVPEGLPEGPLWRAAWEQALTWLNQYRNLIQQRHPCAVVLAGPEYLIRAARESAPDLWSVRAISASIKPAAAAGSPGMGFSFSSSAHSGLRIDPEFAMREARRLLSRKGAEAQAAQFFDRAARGFAARNRRREALEASLSAVALARQSTKKDRDAFLPDLAMSLNTLANMQSAVGQRQEALKTAGEAVELCRELVEKNRDAFLRNLAAALNNLATMQREVGQRQEALGTAGEAVGLYRELVGKNRDAFLPDLAMSLNNLATMQSEVGQRQEALKTAGEAVGLYRELVGKNRDAFLPNLAASLNNLATMQSEVGQRQEALVTAGEAAGLYRELVGKNRDAFAVDLARACGPLGKALAGLERFAEAAEAFSEGVRTILPYTEAYPEALVGLTEVLLSLYLDACRSAALAPDPDLMKEAARVLGPHIKPEGDPEK